MGTAGNLLFAIVLAAVGLPALLALAFIADWAIASRKAGKILPIEAKQIESFIGSSQMIWGFIGIFIAMGVVGLIFGAFFSIAIAIIKWLIHLV